ncbi:hypothetical protein FRC14_003911 [Serendipita sp. 396]|nr:hypothetical protein FRC14_003911 [Serendipita sp. 396]KAG8788443.1 hypothetical protein FRC15_004418 [Serendipita sp. 397]KAG8802651.1 hypothetical protein FRC16_009095 [Serendipita sp. 398]KAG8827274.1 hypothetical protein FRC19_004480 [Serendipita sp. 401]KAG8839378.1 hypothetical protein FRC18_011489 [Serendipita sp. 400]KAG8858447.1 hypothetical protein FRB91_009757 [Serendipita sp. 411]KAG8872899.1 hypothetical protein FRC20_008908 [Serendipita sp. 405]
MSSAVYYRFKSQKAESRIPIDGTGISVFDLKREIILVNGLEKVLDIDLQVFDQNAEEEYADDYLVPRSSSVIVKRVPIIKGARSRFGRYLASAGPRQQQPAALAQHNRVPVPVTFWPKGAGAVSKRFDGKEDAKLAPTTNVAAPILPPPDVQGDEGAAIQAMFQATDTQWQETQEHMAQQQRVFAAPRLGTGGGGGGGGPGGRKSYYHEQKELPPGYICYRCGLGGHWIHDCPTNNDPNFDKKRIRRTTGIPRSMLEAVERPTEGSGPLAQGVMVTPDGGYVIARPDIAAWEKQRARSKMLTEADIRERIPQGHQLACPICSKLVQNAVKTPCCNTTYCEECLDAHLSDNDFICPNCRSKIVSLASVKPDTEARKKADEYIDNAFEEHRQKEAKSANVIAKEDEGNEQAQQNPFDGIAPDPNALQAQITEMQAQLSQVQRMMNESNISAQGRMNAQMQAAELTQRIANTQQLLQIANQIINVTAAAAAAEASANNQNNNYRGNWQPAYQQPASADSAYQRLPVNPRRRVAKRPAEWDADGRDAKQPRFWE